MQIMAISVRSFCPAIGYFHGLLTEAAKFKEIPLRYGLCINASLAPRLMFLCEWLQYKVKDMTQADFGRLEIELAEAEMPGLIACR
jgi:hypothetical protein